MATNYALPPVLLRLLEKFPAVGVETRMSTHHHEQIPAEEITKFVGRQLGNHLGQFIADNILLDKPGALDMEDCHDMTIRFRAQVHVLSPGEIRSLLQQAYDAGRAEQRWDCDFNS